jgi:hypothetical protein
MILIGRYCQFASGIKRFVKNHGIHYISFMKQSQKKQGCCTVMKRLVFALCLMFFSASLTAQDEQWWRNNVNWDGVSGYQKYIKFSPGFMGPNALPVPFVRNGLIDSVSCFTITASGHFRKGEVTFNPALYASYVLVPGVISFDAWYVPAEWFQTSHELKTERKIYYWYYNTKWAKGDAVLNTNIQLLKKQKDVFQLALRMGFRFPTSNGVGAARFTDGAGYYFDLNAGKAMNPSKTFYWKAMLGFYSWQLGNLVQQQNDALLFGAGAEYKNKKRLFECSVAGYMGYLKNSGDKPLVARVGYEEQLKNMKLQIRLQQGLNDFRYTSLEAGAGYVFKKKQASEKKQ